jgi:TRAP-type mannitol/chloroaromatic compound transport system substrate-binding protein
MSAICDQRLLGGTIMGSTQIISIDDLKGIQMRIGGYGGAVMTSLGVELVNLPFSGKAIENAL